MAAVDGDLSGAGSQPTRRRFLTGALSAGATVPLIGWGRPGCGTRPPTPPAGLPDGLFALGVASGDPLPHAVVIWTRLAPAPLDRGGMPAVDVPVRWEMSTDETFGRNVKRGDVIASPRWAHSVHVDVTGLRPGAWYHYRFIVGDQVSPATACGSSSAAARTGRRATGRCGPTPPPTTRTSCSTWATTSTRAASAPRRCGATTAPRSARSRRTATGTGCTRATRPCRRSTPPARGS